MTPPCLDSMKNFGEDPFWEMAANELILQVGQNERVAGFISEIHAAKVQIERQMRKDLCAKLMSDRISDRIHFILGKDLIRRLRSYIGMLTSFESAKLLIAGYERQAPAPLRKRVTFTEKSKKETSLDKIDIRGFDSFMSVKPKSKTDSDFNEDDFFQLMQKMGKVERGTPMLRYKTKDEVA